MRGMGFKICWTGTRGRVRGTTTAHLRAPGHKAESKEAGNWRWHGTQGSLGPPMGDRSYVKSTTPATLSARKGVYSDSEYWCVSVTAPLRWLYSVGTTCAGARAHACVRVSVCVCVCVCVHAVCVMPSVQTAAHRTVGTTGAGHVSTKSAAHRQTHAHGPTGAGVGGRVMHHA